MPLDYLDFELEIGLSDSADYLITVRSRTRIARELSSFPFTDAELEAQLLRLENAILRTTGHRRTKLSPRETTVQSFGLLVGEARSLYYECQQEAASQGKGLRIKLHVQSPQLAALPWEFLYDPRKRDYICLDPHTPLVRYPELAQSTTPLAVAPPLRILGMVANPTPPLRILGMVANPTDLTQLDVDEEKHRVEEALQTLLRRSLVELTWLPGQTGRDLQQFMRPGYGPWHIFHFVGHGQFDAERDEGRIVLADDQGRARPLSARLLGGLLAGQRASLRLALLNACEGARGGPFDVLSSSAATLVLSGLPAVLAMQYAITDAAALEFARTFYTALADNLPVDTAVVEARNAINLQDEYSLEWGTPVLYLRAADGMLFVLKSSQEQDHSVEAPEGESTEWQKDNEAIKQRIIAKKESWEQGREIETAARVNLRRTPGYLNKQAAGDILQEIPTAARLVILNNESQSVDGIFWWNVSYQQPGQPSIEGWVPQTNPNGVMLLRAIQTRPFPHHTEIDPEPTAPLAVRLPQFQRRDSVQHSKSGIGMVIESVPTQDDEEVIIAFPGVGIKKLLASLAKLKKV
ncbi:MAG: hypothetical protein DCC55_20780 [Chloroflexi bacterium]|nr:MAG: hypothetical protein DCC55_20780 [Chloroflexota bacterium]